jgi:hypothetical protein
VVTRPFDRERAGEVLEAGSGGVRVRVAGRRCDEDDQLVRVLRREHVGADGVPGVIERLSGVGGGGSVDQRICAVAGPQLTAARERGLEVAGQVDACEGAFAENGGVVGG